ncbi:MAG: leucine-rich repeat protein [Blautia sp.]|nr:leucine-rich repeat protein [Blautia sp.]MCM1218347.1 leucine-rich repeat protein [Lachnospiraceae bacterium]
MKRKRLLALFLVLSMAFDSGGFTALAAGTGTSENTALTADEIDMAEETEAGETDDTAADTDGSGEIKDETPDEGGANEAGTETDKTETGEPDGNEDGSDGAETETPDESGSGNNGTETGTPDESETGNNGAETGTPDETEGDETESDAPQTGESDKTETVGKAIVKEARMRTFTDETGMVVAYDANAEYQYTVTAGVLTDIKTSSGAAVSGTVVIDSGRGIKTIGTNAFKGNEAVTYVKLPSGVESIEQGAFQGCSALTGITIPAGTKTVGNSAFENCQKLTQLAIPKTVTAIGSRAFYSDRSLFMVYMKDAAYSSLESIGDSAFYQCVALTEFCSDTDFIFPEKLQSIGASAFAGCNAITDIVLPDSVTTIGSSAFRECIALTDVTLSNGMEVISEYAFYGCRKLMLVNFAAKNKVVSAHAFENCQSLGIVLFPIYLEEIQSYAFKGCTGLKKVEVPTNARFGEDEAFPNSSDLCMIGHKDSTTEEYASTRKIRFVSYEEEDTEEFFKCVVQIDQKASDNDNIHIYVYDEYMDKLANEQNDKKGVKAGTELSVQLVLGAGSKLIEGTLRCNGVPITKNKDNDYVFKMPKGGALITAEFTTSSGSKNINALKDEVKYEFSNGDLLPAGNGVELKVGQTTRLFLVDTSDNNSVVSTSKITFKSNKPTVASISSNGTIKALAKGSATITTTVKGRDGADINKNLYVDVVMADVTALKLKLSSDNRSVEIDQTGEVPVLSIDQTGLNGKDLTFQATVTAYDENDDNLAVALKWSSSDTSVAKPVKATTADADSSNTVTIPKNAGGEAVITVTATNSDKKTLTKKFLVCVRDYTPILKSSTLNLNPNQENGVEMIMISAYGKTISSEVAEQVKIVDKNGNQDFLAEYDRSSTGSIARFRVIPSHTLSDGKKSVKVTMTMGDVDYEIPLQIVVKKSYPNPKVAFDKKQPKINLFYANDGTEVRPVITNLGDAEISEYSLKPLKEDKDEVFTENFTIDSEGVITQKSDSIRSYTHNNKPAVTGYLVLKFAGYKDDNSDYTKEYKITIPTQTVKPSYQLEKTSGTFQSGNSVTVALKIIDKKTKEQLVLDDSIYEITNLDGSVVSKNQYAINSEGELELTVPKGQQSGNFKFSVRNTEWALNSAATFTYKITVSDKDPKITLKNATVKLNKKYPEQSAAFVLSSNQLGTEFAPEQEFIAKAPRGKEEEYEKIAITCDENGNGQVELLEPDIAKGSYKYECTVKGSNSGYDATFNKVTLTVKVEETAPTVTAKGSLSLNRLAVESETAELALTYKNLPEDYTIAEQETLESIRCTTKGSEGIESSFSWKIEDNKLVVGLTGLPSAKTYSFAMTPGFDGAAGIVSAKDVKFKVKVHSGAISVKLSAKGKLNLLDRGSEEYTQKNSIICTPSITNLKDTVAEAKIYDVTNRAVEYEDEESAYFDVALLEDGKLYITPKADAEIENNKTYKVRMWVRLENYSFEGNDGGTWCAKDVSIKTAQTLPKVTTDRSSLSLYTARKDYEAEFIVTPKEGSVGKVSGISFGEKDEKSQESFDLTYVPQDDGTLKVSLTLKTPSYPCNKATKIKMYVEFEGQGVNTSGTAITMSVNIVSRN